MTDMGLSYAILLAVVYGITAGYGRSATAGAVCLYLCEPGCVVSLMKAWTLASQFASCGMLGRYAAWRVLDASAQRAAERAHVSFTMTVELDVESRTCHSRATSVSRPIRLPAWMLAGPR